MPYCPTYKILDFPELTVDGSFPLGAAVTAVLLTRGVNAWLTLPVAMLIGAAAGLCTGLIHVRAKVRDLLAGIITMTALYSVNLQIAGSNLMVERAIDTIYTSAPVMVLLGGVRRKTVCAALGTIAGTALALLFGLLAQSLARVDGMRLADVEPLWQLRQTGTPIGRYIHEERMKKAALLLQAGASPERAAEATGFSDVKYFRQVFAKNRGLSVSSYVKGRGRG